MKMTFIISYIAFTLFSTTGYAQEGRNESLYNVLKTGTSNIGFIDGIASKATPYDPVAIFTNSIAVPGNKSITAKSGEITYLFSSEDNARLFKNDPEKFEPTYGGWCARAMVVGQKVSINPSIFTVVGNRSFFFVNQRAKRYFDRMLETNIRKADSEWERISGEKPRK